ncbi:mechanosensitive ion channel family protein [Prosthecochloris sp. ZM_2]|uniref:mechanosensitive ion channel family protein n=1 Tax=Prosthecochloris sp. ZM_2 TaxID=2045206 RepID=UPI000DF78171|nr:mechanosensitive ion channel domain-containing protein [Prosthecochloris sp. ZM_2]RNA65900.1 mechanosensitive ion channel family protein [Prosthecochloris sp. ZM_2]
MMMDASAWLSDPEVMRVAVPLLALAAAILLYLLSGPLLKRVVGRLRRSLRQLSVPFELLFVPFRTTLVLVVMLMFLPSLPVSPPLLSVANHLLVILFILVLAWLSLRLLRVLSSLILGRYEVGEINNLEARRVTTHLELIRKILNVIIVVIAVSAALMTFDAVRQVGISVLASAGVAGIILGFAAQKSIATLIAGIQIAVTQPIRIDDVVIVENEWGRIEEITLTYVVVRIWDQRRLVVPISHFLDKPFQNWTRSSAELIGTVYLHADYRIDVDALRAELQRIVESTPLWDRRVSGLQVTGANDRSVELRALVSAANSSDAWDLRCLVRERLLAFLQSTQPESLPKIRLEPGPGEVKRKEA